MKKIMSVIYLSINMDLIIQLTRKMTFYSFEQALKYGTKLVGGVFKIKIKHSQFKPVFNNNK